MQVTITVRAGLYRVQAKGSKFAQRAADVLMAFWFRRTKGGWTVRLPRDDNPAALAGAFGAHGCDVELDWTPPER